MEGQEKADNYYERLSDYNSIPGRSTIADQQENGGPWTSRTIIDKGDHNNNDWSYRVHVMKIG